MARLLIEQEDVGCTVFRLEERGATLGRGEENDIVILDRAVSRQHARIEKSVAGFVLVDCQSRHGTKVDGAPVDRHTLQEGNEIRLGNQRLLYRDGPHTASTGEETTTEATGASETLKRSDPKANLFSEIGALITSMADPAQLLERLAELASDAVGAERGAVLLLGRGTKLETMGAPGVGLPMRSLIEPVLRSGEPILLEDVSRDARLSRSESVVSSRIRSAMCVPIYSRGRIVGVLYADHSGPGRFRAADLALFRSVTAVAGAALTGSRILDLATREASRLSEGTGPDHLIGDSPRMEELRELVRRYAPVESTVLIQGETGTGKELVARWLHRLSPRATKPFVAINCAAIPDEMIESELFGHEKGAFTGATGRKRGVFELADDGTLFLDEIGEMSLRTQAKVLRALDQREIWRVGSEKPVSIDVRIISASHRDLVEDTKTNRFREDLSYRLRVLEIRAPPLRERKEDIGTLIRHFAGILAPRLGRPRPQFSEGALLALQNYRWPGNVRELRNEVERALIRSEGPEIDIAHLTVGRKLDPPKTEENEEKARSLKERWAWIAEMEKTIVREALAKSEGNVAAAARLLGVGRTVLRTRLAKNIAEDE